MFEELVLAGKARVSAKAKREKLERDLDRAKTDLEKLRHQPVTRADLASKTDAFVDGQRRMFLEAVRNFGELEAIQREPSTAPIPQNGRKFHFLASLNYPGEQTSPENLAFAIQRALCFLFPEEMKRAMRSAADVLDFEDAGPTLDKRPKLASELQAEIERLGKELRELLEHAAENQVPL